MPMPPDSSSTTNSKAMSVGLKSRSLGGEVRNSIAAVIWVATQALSSTVPRPLMRMFERLNGPVELYVRAYGKCGGTVSI